MWKRTAKGLILTFHLAGINNQNFLMRDDQTGTFWQQISGRAISGPLTGAQLELVYSDELSFGLWRGEAPQGSILKAVEKYSSNYESKDWEVRMAKARTVIDFPNTGLQSRDLVLGVTAGGASRAYPVQRILSEKLVEDRLGGEPILLVVGPDDKSIRVFQARVHPDEQALEYYRETTGAFLMDSTGNEWNFSGCAVSGKRKGSCLKPVPATKDYWFDWRNYHPATTVFKH
ncbi:MAG: DUF3179 domain-containing protein [Acidobacteriaceae bacterium]|nr:DUF3179 domain-containing protein [Acidobacteriaceae bacterium]